MSYEADYYAWTREQAAELRRLAEKGFDGAGTLDLMNLAGEIEEMGDNTIAVVEGLIEQILFHFLKLSMIADPMPRNHWMREIDAFRGKIDLRVYRSPTVLKRVEIGTTYRIARRRIGKMVPIEHAKRIPTECPWALTLILDEDYYPDPTNSGDG